MAQGRARLYLGIDAGGTKTHALLADVHGQVLALSRAGTGNWELVGLDGMRDTLQCVVNDAVTQAGVTITAIKASAYGLAGLDWPSDKPMLESTIAQLRLPGCAVIVNDMFVALRAGTTRPWGVVVGAGTGFAAAGRNRAAETARTLGLSPDWGDWGGGRNITQAAIAAVARAYIGLAPPTLLSDSLAMYAGMPDVESLLRAVSRENLELTGAAPLIFEAAAAGDEPARAILERAGKEMAASTNLIIRKLRMEQETFDLVLAGSLFRAQEPLLTDTLISNIQAVAPKAHPVKLKSSPAVGAVLLAMEADGLRPGEAVHQHLLETVNCFKP
jgi:N-acetylglucosamine kinase-like BadF-type ATPase